LIFSIFFLFIFLIKTSIYMGKLKIGILGNVKGKVGPVVGSVVGGQNVVKAMPSSYADKNSVAQQNQRTAFAATLEWYKALAPALADAYPERKSKLSGYNTFMQDNVNSAITGTTVNWNGLKIGKGSLTNPEFTATATEITNQAQFNWVDDSDGSAKLATDKVVLVVIEPVSKSVHVSNGAYTRASGSALLTLPSIMVGKELQTYAYMKRADGSKASAAKRTGRFTAGSDLAGNLT
jgi:hypothetical protein